MIKVNEQEREELLEFFEREQAIDRMFNRCLASQQQLISERERWFTEIRKNHDIQEGHPIRINHGTGEISDAPAADMN